MLPTKTAPQIILEINSIDVYNFPNKYNAKQYIASSAKFTSSVEFNPVEYMPF